MLALLCDAGFPTAGMKSAINEIAIGDCLRIGKTEQKVVSW